MSISTGLYGKKDSVVNFFKNYNSYPLKIYLGESTNLLQESDFQKKAKNLVSKFSSLGYTCSLYEKSLNRLNNDSEIREYIFCIKKNNKFSLSFLLLNMQSKMNSKVRKVNLYL